MIDLELSKLKDKNLKVRYGHSKMLVEMAKETPMLLYPYYDFWVELINGSNSVLCWNAIDIIGYLSKVDGENRTKDIIPKLFELLHCGKLITTNHAISSLGTIARNKQIYASEIIDELVKIHTVEFTNVACKNIAIGKAIDTLSAMPRSIVPKSEVIDFILDSSIVARKPTATKACKLLKKLEKSYRVKF